MRQPWLRTSVEECPRPSASDQCSGLLQLNACTNVGSQKATTVNCCKCPIRALSFVAIASMATSVRAGELGPASRGSVGISITIPPHVSVNPAHGTNDRVNAAGDICVQANGLNNYHLVILNAARSLEPVNLSMKPAIAPTFSGEAICDHGTGVTKEAISYLLPSTSEQQIGSLMIVVTPD